MMNIASLELCRELFELSGWDNHSEIGDWLPDQNGKYELRGGPWYNQYPRIPAYDLGYLLRKIYVEAHSHEDDLYLVRWKDGEEWRCWTIQYSNADATADTPEDAACKLAIALFRMPQTPASGGKQ